MKPIDKTKTVAFTGYREEKILKSSKDPKILSNITNHLTTVIEHHYEQGYRTFLSGMAQGFDLMAAERVINLKQKYPDIQLIAVIPFPEQADDFSDFWKNLYSHCLDNADQTVMIAPRYYSGCYYARNDFLIEFSSVIICYFDGQSGGTKYTVTKANKKGLEMINILDKMSGH